jgi:hypothetical protein
MMTGNTCHQLSALKQNKSQLDGFFGSLVQLAQPLFNLPQNRFNGHGISPRPFMEVANPSVRAIAESFEKLASILCEWFFWLIAVRPRRNVANCANLMVYSAGLFKFIGLVSTMPV